MNIHLSTVLQENQRYPTCGDWFEREGMTKITVSKMGIPDYEFLVALHELIEMHLCKKRGISQASVDEFDMKYEEDREAFNVNGEPGDSKNAPYHKEHRFATKIEKLVAKELKVNWKEYEKTIDNL